MFFKMRSTGGWASHKMWQRQRRKARCLAIEQQRHFILNAAANYEHTLVVPTLVFLAALAILGVPKMALRVPESKL